MKGRRLPDVPWGGDEHQLEPGDYFKLGENLWAIRAPNGDEGTIGLQHVVVEHDDGTITAMPSIQFDHGGRWHGYLARGVWKAC